MQALIFAAGMGTRLKPLTDTMPKALVPVAGKPLLEILIDKLKKSGFDEVVINVHHFADMIEDYVHAHGDFGINVKFSDEREMLLETGGGVKQAAKLFSDKRRPFLIHNVDILNDLDLGEFYKTSIERMEKSGTAQIGATLMVSNRKTRRYLLFDDDNMLVGWTNIETGEVRTPYPSLDVDKCHRHAFSGIHIFSPMLLPYMDEMGSRFPIMDFYLSICDKVKIYGCVRDDVHLIDVGKQDTLTAAESFFNEYY